MQDPRAGCLIRFPDLLPGFVLHYYSQYVYLYSHLLSIHADVITGFSKLNMRGFASASSFSGHLQGPHRVTSCYEDSASRVTFLSISVTVRRVPRQDLRYR